MTKYKKVFGRRTMLRGAGTIAIGLPFLDAMRTTSVFAAAPEPPARAYNLFFGLGMPTPLQSEGFAGPMEPLQELQSKLLIIRGIDQVRCDEGGINAHFDGSSGAFTAEKPNGESRAGGPSLDQVLRQAAYPNGQPAGVIPTLLAGTYFRRSRQSRYVHSWGSDGSAADLPKESAPDLFDRIFGEDTSMEPDDPVVARQKRLRRSVLDSVVGQYQHYQSEASNLGVADRAKIADHLERIREYELRAFPTGGGGQCPRPSPPPPSEVAHGGAADPGGQGIDITLDELVTEWRLVADLYALAVHCDLVRFGALTFQAAGERLRVQGRYEYDGQLVYDFDDRAERGGGGGSGQCSHEWWHEFNENNSNTQLRAHAHLMQRELVYFMKQLDEPEHADENGLSILENAMLTISTESGDGRHNNVTRELSGVYHAITGANERFKTGQFIDVDAEGLDLYNTMLEAMGVSQRLGPSGRALNRVSQILR